MQMNMQVQQPVGFYPPQQEVIVTGPNMGVNVNGVGMNMNGGVGMNVQYGAP